MSSAIAAATPASVCLPSRLPRTESACQKVRMVGGREVRQAQVAAQWQVKSVQIGTGGGAAKCLQSEELHKEMKMAILVVRAIRV